MEKHYVPILTILQNMILIISKFSSISIVIIIPKKREREALELSLNTINCIKNYDFYRVTLFISDTLF